MFYVAAGKRLRLSTNQVAQKRRRFVKTRYAGEIPITLTLLILFGCVGVGLGPSKRVPLQILNTPIIAMEATGLNTTANVITSRKYRPGKTEGF